MAKKIVEEHGGSIRAENRSGGGAIFTVRLPYDADSTRQIASDKRLTKRGAENKD